MKGAGGCEIKETELAGFAIDVKCKNLEAAVPLGFQMQTGHKVMPTVGT